VKRGYQGGISIEPHLAVVFHDQSVKSSDEIRYANYGVRRRMMKIIDEAKGRLRGEAAGSGGGATGRE